MESGMRDIVIFYSGREQCDPGHYFGPAIRHHYLLHVVLGGEGIYQVKGERHCLKAGEAFLIKPQEVTYYQADQQNPWEYAWIAFGGNQAERLLETYRQGDGGYLYQFKREGNGQWRQWIEGLVTAYERAGHNQDEMTGYVYLLFSSMVRKETSEADFERNYLERARQYIHHNFSYPIRIEDVAWHVGIDRTYLYKLFKKYMGISPKQYLTMYRIMEAKRLLEETTLSVVETGLSCGFHDASVFCKNFQKWEGEAPLQYRKNRKRE